MTDASYFYRDDRPLIIAHRGSHGHFPEHSLGGYADAYYSGADFIELDLQITKDGFLVCQHDAYLDDTTNILQLEIAFADRRRADNKFYVNDFSLAELKTLKRTQKYAERSQKLNANFQILTLQEVIDDVRRMGRDRPRRKNSDACVGLYIELKHYQ